MTRFDALVGASGEPFDMPIETGKIREFARAVHATDPIHHDEAAARAAGFAGLVAPLTFSATTAHWSNLKSLPQLNLDMARVLAAGGEWQYHDPLVAGDVVTVNSTLESVTPKTGTRGPMAILRVRTDFTRDGAVVQQYTANIMHIGGLEEDE